MARVRVEPRSSALRCAWCHEAGEELAACPSCGTRFHAECPGLGRRCPTLGCATPAPVRSRRLQAWVGAIASAVLGVEAALWRHDAAQPPPDRPQTPPLQCDDPFRREGWLGELRCGDDGAPRRVEVSVGPGDPCTVVVAPFDGAFPDPSRSLKLELQPGSRPTSVHRVELPGLGALARVYSRSDVAGYIGLRRDGRPVVCWQELHDARPRWSSWGNHPAPRSVPNLGAWKPSERRPVAERIADVAGDDPIARLVALLDLEALLKADRLGRPDAVREAVARLTGVEEPWTKYAVARLLGRFAGTWPVADH